MQLPHVHLCIVQPLGYVHALGFIDQARFFRHQFRRMGASVTLAKNRLRHDAVNFVFGAHLGFDAGLRQRHSCIFVNLEQLGAEGAAVTPAYLQLLASSAVVDYHADNVGAYQARSDDVPLFSFAHAPYLQPTEVRPLAERAIDLLFFGSMNERRRALIERLERSGRSVTLLDGPVYGPERDALVMRAKAVLNLHFYPTARFEQARVFQCLSLGTPVISERGPGSAVPAQFEDSVHWIDVEQIDDYFRTRFDTPQFHAASAQQLAAFASHDVIGEYAELLAFAAGYRQVHQQQMVDEPWRPTRLHIGSGKDYKPGWLNVDILASAQPDAVLDLARPLPLPLQIDNPQIGPTELHAGNLQRIYANNVLEHVSDLPRLMGNCLRLLADGGVMDIEVPYERAPTAWQDPTHVRALNENSWLYYTDWFWYLGWFEHRFALRELSYLDARLKPCQQEGAHFMRVRLAKTTTSLAERMTARTLQADFGGLPDDGGDEATPAAETETRPAGHETSSACSTSTNPEPALI